MSALAQPTSESSGVPSKPRLLLVENEPSLRQLLNELLCTEYELVVAADGERAWELAIQELPLDLVLSDVKMPGMDGIELTRRLRAEERSAIVPIILFSADNRLPTLLEGLEAGADDFLHKPFRPPELLARLRSRHQLCAMRRERLTHKRASG